MFCKLVFLFFICSSAYDFFKLLYAFCRLCSDISVFNWILGGFFPMNNGDQLVFFKPTSHVASTSLHPKNPHWFGRKKGILIMVHYNPTHNWVVQPPNKKSLNNQTFTPWKFNCLPLENIPGPKRKGSSFQPSFFRGFRC